MHKPGMRHSASTLTELLHETFCDCRSLRTIAIPNDVQLVGNSAFEGCCSLECVELPDSVTFIGEKAFFNCKRLTRIKFPNKLADIGGGALLGTQWYESQPDGPVYVNNVLYSFKGCCPSYVTVRPATTSIAQSAFESCKALSGISLPDGLKTIENSAFRRCSSLKSIGIPRSCSHIGSKAFENCLLLTNFEMDSFIGTIGMEAFSGTAWHDKQDDGVTYLGHIAVGHKGNLPSKVSIKPGVVGIADHAFENCTSLVSVDLPEGVESIGDWAFFGCSSLMRIRIPSTLKRIGYDAFSYCSSLVDIGNPRGLTEVGARAFGIGGDNNRWLDTAWFRNRPDGVVYAGSIACGHKGTYPERLVLREDTIGIAAEAFMGAPILSVALPPGLTTIGNCAFEYCDRLSSLEIPDSTKRIGDFAFSDCGSLALISTPADDSRYGLAVFHGCPVRRDRRPSVKMERNTETQPMKKRFLLLANSIRRGCRCIAGREMFRRDDKWFYGPWIRPVSQQGEGEVPTQDSLYANGTQPAVLDVAEVTLTAKQELTHQPENYLIDSSARWQKIGAIPGSSLAAIEEHPAHLWLQSHGRSDRIHTTVAVTSLVPFQSLYLIRPVNLRFRIWEAVDDFRGGPRKHRRAIFTFAGAEYNLTITDPTMEARYFRPFPALNQPPKEIVPKASSNVLLVVSLSAPFKDGYHYKVVATVLEY